MTHLLDSMARVKRSDTQSFADAWVGLEPTFSSRKAVRKWQRHAGTKRGEDRYFESRSLLRVVRRVGKAIRKRYRALAKDSDAACVFGEHELVFDRDPWGVERANVRFTDTDTGNGEGFEVRFGIDPETFEHSIKPTPLAWLYDEGFASFLQKLVWEPCEDLGLEVSMAHGGGQFSFSAKTWMQGSLLADDVAHRVDHPELATFCLDYPNSDGRSFRATARRREAFRRILAQYWAGAFHPRALGPLTAENALLDRGFGPADPREHLVDPARGPLGSARDVFQTNFAFGRALRWQAQNVEPGYWQATDPDEDGYRPDQIMRYSECNLNRLRIAGEWHVKSGKVLDHHQVPELDAPLDLDMLYGEASWEQRAQMSKGSASDMIEAVLLEAHHAQWLLQNPNRTVRGSLLQDQLLGDARRTLERRDPEALGRLERAARAQNLAASRGRIRSSWIEPEDLFWPAWHALEPGERAEIAREAVLGFVERVANAASVDPRRNGQDPMEPHRHRIHPVLWEALASAGAPPEGTALAHELRSWREGRARYFTRRPQWSVTDASAPWHTTLVS